MQENTKKKSGAVLSAVVMILLLGSYLGLFLYVALVSGFVPAAVVILVIYGIVVVISILCILYAMRQRIKELNSGEEEEAKEY